MASPLETEYAVCCRRWFFEKNEDARKAIEAVKSPGPWTEPTSAATAAALTRMGLAAPWTIAADAIGRLHAVHRAIRSEFHAAAAAQKQAAFSARVDALLALRDAGSSSSDDGGAAEDDGFVGAAAASSYGSTAAESDLEAGAPRHCAAAVPPIADQKATLRTFSRAHGSVFGAGPFFRGLKSLLTAQLANERSAMQWRLLDITFTEMGGSDAFADDAAALMVTTLGCTVERISTLVDPADADSGGAVVEHAPIAETVWTLSPALSDRSVRALVALLPRDSSLSGRATGVINASAVPRRISPRERTTCC